MTRLELLMAADRVGWDSQEGVELRRQAKDLYDGSDPRSMRPGCRVRPCRYYWIRVHYPGCSPHLTVGEPYYGEDGEVEWWDVTGSPGRVLELSWVEPIEEIREPRGA